MAEWKYKIDLKEIWKKVSEYEIDIPEAGKRIASVLRKHEAYKEHEAALEEIASQFEDVDNTQEFDYVLQDLYDWADTQLPPMDSWPHRRIAWIATQF